MVSCSASFARRRDPKNMNRDAFNEVRDMVGNQVLGLIDEIREKAEAEQRPGRDTAA